jgi:hypothetical protein
MSKKKRYQNILLPTIFFFLIATMLCAGYAAASPCVDISSSGEIEADGTASEYSIVSRTSNLFGNELDAIPK